MQIEYILKQINHELSILAKINENSAVLFLSEFKDSNLETDSFIQF